MTRTLDEIAIDLELEVEAMESEANARWLRIGALLNEGRAQFRGDREFGQWLNKQACFSKLEEHPAVLSSAMWAAAT